jgi:hypothetical protein
MPALLLPAVRVLAPSSLIVAFVPLLSVIGVAPVIETSFSVIAATPFTTIRRLVFVPLEVMMMLAPSFTVSMLLLKVALPEPFVHAPAAKSNVPVLTIGTVRVSVR